MTLTSTWSRSKWKACSDQFNRLFVTQSTADQFNCQHFLSSILIQYFHVCTVQPELTHVYLFMIFSRLFVNEISDVV